MAKLRFLLLYGILLGALGITALVPRCYAQVEILETFESWNDNGWTSVTGGTGGTKGQDVPNATSAYSGNYGAWFYASTPSGAVSSTIKLNNLTLRDTYYLDFMVKFDELTLGGGAWQDQFYYAKLEDEWGDNFFRLCVWEGDMVFSVDFYNGTYGYVVENSTISVEESIWYRVTLGVFKNITNGFVKVWIDGELAIDWSGDNDASEVPLQWTTLGSWIYAGSVETSIDDIQILYTEPDFDEDEPSAYDISNAIIMGIGLLGAGLIFLSWLVAWDQWKQDLYANAIGYWLAMFCIGIGLFTVFLGG